MADHARSDDPAVQAQLDRFAQLSPGRDILGLERIAALMAALGNPHRTLPPVFHVAGTNGKGSTCAFLRAAIEAAGLTAHVYTSPHLCRFNERIRIAGSLITDEALAPLLSTVLDAAEANAIGPSFFEATTAAALLAFSCTPADVAIIEVGLGGRLDATNIIEAPAVCGIAQLGIDHQSFLGNDAVTIAGEKAGIAKRGVPLVTMDYPDSTAKKVAAVAGEVGAPLIIRKQAWDSAPYEGRLHYRDEAGKLSVPLPRLAGDHQQRNAALAIAMIRHQSAVTIPEAALKAAMGWTEWPARMQRLSAGPLAALAPEGSEIWLDGCHNPAGAELVANYMRQTLAGRPLSLICGILANKDAEGILHPFLPLIASLTAIPIPGHDHHAPSVLAAIAGTKGRTALAVDAAMRRIDTPGVVLIMGSLYLAGEVLKTNDQLPD
jgi:dihydrofolate synthase / folylpolyglutamate synthase